MGLVNSLKVLEIENEFFETCKTKVLEECGKVFCSADKLIDVTFVGTFR